MNKGKLSQEEKTLLDAVESGEYESMLTKSRKKELEAAANLTFKKDKRIIEQGSCRYSVQSN